MDAQLELMSSPLPRTAKSDRVFDVLSIVCVTLLALIFIAAIAWQIVNLDKIRVKDAGMSPTIDSGDMVHVESTIAQVHRGDVIEIDTESAPGWERARDVRVLRVVGMPGDRIERCEDVLVCINGELLPEQYLTRGAATTFPMHGRGSCYSESPLFGCIVPEDSLLRAR